MTVHQLSIFIENKAGTLVGLLRQLKEANISLIAISISDTMDYGICRIICSEPMKAYEFLKDAGVAVSLREVIAVELDDEPGRAADAIGILSDEGLSIAYMYSFRLTGKGVIVFRTDDNPRAIEALRRGGLTMIREDDLSKLV
ncbi:MAG: amino acid-binding protein [Bacteroidales bacterium]|nr:amino acid-binding protein [Bacteroidales bacterium]MBQ5944522.1 amino acid-binding protein [Bacteroidales bacterium]